MMPGGANLGKKKNMSAGTGLWAVAESCPSSENQNDQCKDYG